LRERPNLELTEADLSSVVFATSSPFVFHFQEEERGKAFYYMLCWVNNRGVKGIRGAILSAIVP
jgi:hypothetical protein